MTPDGLDCRVERLLYEELNLQDGEMMMPLKSPEIDSLRAAIHNLVSDAVQEATR